MTYIPENPIRTIPTLQGHLKRQDIVLELAGRNEIKHEPIKRQDAVKDAPSKEEMNEWYKKMEMNAEIEFEKLKSTLTPYQLKMVGYDYAYRGNNSLQSGIKRGDTSLINEGYRLLNLGNELINEANARGAEPLEVSGGFTI